MLQPFRKHFVSLRHKCREVRLRLNNEQAHCIRLALTLHSKFGEYEVSEYQKSTSCMAGTTATLGEG